jgi:hypothetical protein
LVLVCTQVVLKFLKLITEAQQREAVVQKGKANLLPVMVLV